jgi:hypothetical protein
MSRKTTTTVMAVIKIGSLTDLSPLRFGAGDCRSLGWGPDVIRQEDQLAVYYFDTTSLQGFREPRHLNM